MNLNRFYFSGGDGGRTLLIKSLSPSLDKIVVYAIRRILCVFTQLLFRYLFVVHS